MAYPSDAVSLPAARFNTDRTLISERAVAPQPVKKTLAMRKYQIASLRPDGDVKYSDQIGPAMPIFEAAFSAFTHGTLISTDTGQVPVEDLVPGMKVMTANRGARRLLWVGSMVLVPKTNEISPSDCRLTRITADSFGMSRPQSDMMVGPGARLVQHNAQLEQTTGQSRLLAPASHLVDGVNVIDIKPPQPVTVYHLCLQQHAIISAGGLEMETYHPGPRFEADMGQNMLSLFLSFFRHIKAPADFGPLAAPRLSLQGQSEKPQVNVA